MSTQTTNINRWGSIATDPLRNFKFYAEFRPATANGSKDVFNKDIVAVKGGFTSINGLSINTQSIPYREGGYNTTIHQIPGMTTFSPITFQRGALTSNTQGIKWMRGLFAAASGDGITVNPNGTTDFRVDIDIYILDHPAHIDDKMDLETIAKMQFRVHNAWITTLSYSDLNAGDQNILFEQMTLVHEGLSVGFTKGDTALTQY